MNKVTYAKHDSTGFPGPMLARDYEKHQDEPLNWRYVLVSEKLNGVRGLLSPDNVMWSKNAHPLYALADVFDNPFSGSKMWLDGEIMWPRHSLQDIAGLLNSAHPSEEDLAGLRYHVFDCAVPGLGYSNRYTKLCAASLHSQIVVEPQGVEERITNAMICTHAILNPSLEGLVYRNPDGLYLPERSYNVLKHKRMYEEEFKCLSVYEGKGKFIGMLGGFVLELPQGGTFNCGGGEMNVAQRQQFWATPPIDSLITVRFPYKSTKGIPLQGQFMAVRNYE